MLRDKLGHGAMPQAAHGDLMTEAAPACILGANLGGVVITFPSESRGLARPELTRYC